MEALILIGGLIFSASVGYFAIDRLGHFLDGGGISPDPDREEPVRAGSPAEQDYCGTSGSDVV